MMTLPASKDSDMRRQSEHAVLHAARVNKRIANCASLRSSHALCAFVVAGVGHGAVSDAPVYRFEDAAAGLGRIESNDARRQMIVMADTVLCKLISSLEYCRADTGKYR